MLLVCICVPIRPGLPRAPGPWETHGFLPVRTHPGGEEKWTSEASLEEIESDHSEGVDHLGSSLGVIINKSLYPQAITRLLLVDIKT